MRYGWSRHHDTPRLFGRDLLKFYECLDDYARTASDLALVVEQIDLSDPPGNSLDQSLGVANRLSNELTEIVGTS